MTQFSTRRNYIFRRVVKNIDINSYIDIKLKTSTIQRVELDTQTGYNPSSIYTMTVTIGSSTIPISVSGSQALTISDLVNAITNDLGSSGEAIFSKEDQAIRIRSTSPGDVNIQITNPGTLVSELKGTNRLPLRTKLITSIIGAGVYFELSNVASPENPVNAGFINKAVNTTTGNPVQFREFYDNETGILRILHVSNSLVPGIEVVSMGNLIG